MGDRILQILGPSTGGIRRHVAHLCDGLVRSGWDVAVAGPTGVMAGLRPLEVVAPVQAGPRALTAARLLRTPVRDADVVHAHGLSAGWVASLVRPRPPLVITVHNLVLDEAAGWRAPLLRRLERRLPTRADAVIGVSDAIAAHFPGESVHVIPAFGRPPAPARGRAEVRASYGIEPDAPLAVTVARLHPQKGLDVWLEALVDVRRRVPNVRALIVGDGPDRATLAAKSEELGLSDVVVWAGAQPSAADELAAGDLVVMSSRWEGSPLVVSEAITLGLALVATDVGTIGEWVKDGHTGWVVPVENAPALASAAVDALLDRAEARQRGEAAREHLAGLDRDGASFAAIERVYRGVMQ